MLDIPQGFSILATNRSARTYERSSRSQHVARVLTAGHRRLFVLATTPGGHGFLPLRRSTQSGENPGPKPFSQEWLRTPEEPGQAPQRRGLPDWLPSERMLAGLLVGLLVLIDPAVAALWRRQHDAVAGRNHDRSGIADRSRTNIGPGAHSRTPSKLSQPSLPSLQRRLFLSRRRWSRRRCQNRRRRAPLWP